ncbi:MAG: hypothetical protein A3G41_06845 [Elusimicrobia bacterium RIFCSPLOWO2_12_FULL_59_9]|nr:MAG: hypothetical protein A3G41_06845 [Elusimicrobia bacterium RIFCSPLOWO2_12_FULL_59_9]
MADSILTLLQHDVLEGLFAAGLGDRGYYLTGGTALAEFYFKHRYSDDLDLFTRKGELHSEDISLAEKVFDALGLQIFRETKGGNFARYFMSRSGQSEKLKVEFCLDVGAMMAPPLRQERVVVDSLEDISVNKVCAILGRLPSEPKDFSDLYFILKDTSFTLDYLLTRAREKESAFDDEEGQLRFAVMLRGAGKLERMPKMIRPLTRDEMGAFLIPLADTIIMRFKPEGGGS